jgi:1-acyl-sn-glycerol-3-phosphate acyltransferase
VPKPEPKADAKAKAKAKGDAKEGPLHVFGGNTYDDYYDHPIYEFPVTSRCLLGAAVIVCATIARVAWPWELEDGEYIWDADGGQMIVMNHVSMVDPVLIVVSDWFHGRRVRPIYKSDFDKNRFVTWLFSRIGAIPVDRGKADLKAVRRAQRALMRGEDVLVFPEGTRILSDDQEIEIHAGFALMAQLAKAPVLPMAIVGARDGGIGGNKPIRPGRVYMAVGDPITFDEIEVKGRKQQASEMESRAMKAVYSLRDRLRAKHPGKM